MSTPHAPKPEAPDPEDSQLDEERWDDLLGAAFGDSLPPGEGSFFAELSASGFAVDSIHVPSDARNAPPLGIVGESGARDGRLGRYHLLGEIARGGIGIVLEARDADLGREVAIKRLRGDRAQDPQLVQRFVEEAQIGGQLQHPGIVPVHEVGLDEEGRPWFAMRRIRGETLQRMLTRERPSAERRASLLRIFESVAQTLAYAHSRSVVHRDLKPANILVGTFGEVQIVDWGLAKVLARGGLADESEAAAEAEGMPATPAAPPPSAAGESSPSSPIHPQRGPREEAPLATTRSGPDASHSRDGAVFGTPAYMPPEQARGEVALLDERADVFSLGAILCEILTGHPPWWRATRDDALVVARSGDLAPAFARLAGCDADAELIALARECLAPDPQVRPADAARVAEALEQHRQEALQARRRAELEAAEASSRAAVERQARRRTLVLASLIVLLTLGSAAVWFHQRSQAITARDARADRALEGLAAAEEEWDRTGAPAAVLERLAALENSLDEGRFAPAFEARLRTSLAALRAEARGAQSAAERAARDQRFLSRMAELRSSDALEDSDAISEALQEFGIDPDRERPSAVAQAISEHPDADLREALIGALDAWLQELLPRRGPRPDPRGYIDIFQALQAADPVPERRELRSALVELRQDTLDDVFERAPLDTLGPDAIAFLCARVRDERARTLARAAALRWPEHPGLAVIVARQAHRGVRRQATPLELADAIAQAERALALAPRDPRSWGRLAALRKRRDGEEARLEVLSMARLRLPGEANLAASWTRALQRALRSIADPDERRLRLQRVEPYPGDSWTARVALQGLAADLSAATAQPAESFSDTLAEALRWLDREAEGLPTSEGRETHARGRRELARVLVELLAKVRGEATPEASAAELALQAHLDRLRSAPGESGPPRGQRPRRRPRATPFAVLAEQLQVQLEREDSGADEALRAGRAWLATGDEAEALATIQAGLSRAPQSAPLEALRGQALLSAGRPSEARLALERAVDRGERSLRSSSALNAARRVERALAQLRSTPEERPAALAAIAWDSPREVRHAIWSWALAEGLHREVFAAFMAHAGRGSSVSALRLREALASTWPSGVLLTLRAARGGDRDAIRYAALIVRGALARARRTSAWSAESESLRALSARYAGEERDLLEALSALAATDSPATETWKELLAEFRASAPGAETSGDG